MFGKSFIQELENAQVRGEATIIIGGKEYTVMEFLKKVATRAEYLQLAHEQSDRDVSLYPSTV